MHFESWAGNHKERERESVKREECNEVVEENTNLANSNYKRCCSVCIYFEGKLILIDVIFFMFEFYRLNLKYHHLVRHNTTSYMINML